MPKSKVGSLKPVIHQLQKELTEKKESLSAAERRDLLRRLKRTQRKARRIQREEERKAAAQGKPKEPASVAPAAVAEKAAPETASKTPEEVAAPRDADEASTETPSED